MKATITHSPAARALFSLQKPFIASCWLLCAWAPWLPPRSRTVWLAAAVFLSSHGLRTLEAGSQFVAAAMALIAVAGALFRMVQTYAGRWGQKLQQAGLFAVCLPLSILLPAETGSLYLTILTIFVGLGWLLSSQAAPVITLKTSSKIVGESFPILEAICFLTMGWQYDTQLLIRGLLISAGLSLLGRAFLPFGDEGITQA